MIPQDWFPITLGLIIFFLFFFGDFVGSILEREYSITNSLFYFFVFFNLIFFPIIVIITYNMLWMGPWNFLYSYLYYQKNWLNTLINDLLLNNITKLEPKKNNGLLYKRLPKYTEFCKGWGFLLNIFFLH
jgi:hypothetical protein